MHLGKLHYVQFKVVNFGIVNKNVPTGARKFFAGYTPDPLSRIGDPTLNSPSAVSTASGSLILHLLCTRTLKLLVKLESLNLLLQWANAETYATEHRE